MKKLFMIALAGCAAQFIYGQIPFGNNPATGGYFNTGDAKIYYEVYGSGKPVVLLHGGIYGYIDEFEKLIPVLSQRYQVIAIATRGHGRSELGHHHYPTSFWQKTPIKSYGT
jgi:pimeloyl-ACP methyl ester carboxylesterase